MNDKPDNPSAFPHPGKPTETSIGFLYNGAPGMTLRDYFAAAALTGLLANESAMLGISRKAEKGHGNNLLSLHCYVLADEMLGTRINHPHPSSKGGE